MAFPYLFAITSYLNVAPAAAPTNAVIRAALINARQATSSLLVNHGDWLGPKPSVVQVGGAIRVQWVYALDNTDYTTGILSAFVGLITQMATTAFRNLGAGWSEPQVAMVPAADATVTLNSWRSGNAQADSILTGASGTGATPGASPPATTTPPSVPTAPPAPTGVLAIVQSPWFPPVAGAVGVGIGYLIWRGLRAPAPAPSRRRGR